MPADVTVLLGECKIPIIALQQDYAAAWVERRRRWGRRQRGGEGCIIFPLRFTLHQTREVPSTALTQAPAHDAIHLVFVGDAGREFTFFAQ